MRSNLRGQRICFAPIARLVLVATLPLSSGVLAGESIEVSVSLSDTLVDASDSLTLTCIIRWDDRRVALLSDSPPLPTLKRLEIGSVSAKSESVTLEGEIYSRRTFSYVLKPLRSGLGLISPLQIGYVTLPDSGAALVSSRELSVRIVIPERAGESRGRGWWLWLGLALLVAGGAGGAWFWRAASKRSAEPNPQIELIEGRLRKLRALTLASRRDFYTEAHGLLLHIQSPELAGAALTPDQRQTLDGWLAEAATEKFAPGRGEPGEALRRYVEIESFVQTEIISSLNRTD